MFNYLATCVLNLGSDRKGVTTLEYAVIAAVTVVATGVGMAAISPNLTALWNSIANAV